MTQELTLDATIENIERATEFVEAELARFSCPMRAQMQIAVAIDEVFGNIAKYAYPEGGGTATVRFSTENCDKTAVVSFLDRGIPFNPLAQEDPDTTLSWEERDIGGLGVLVVKKTMDDVSYEYQDGQNIFTMKKKIG